MKSDIRIVVCITMCLIIQNSVNLIAQKLVQDPLICEGQIPLSFRVDLEAEIFKQVSEDTLFKSKNDREDYFTGGTFFINSLYQSGMVLFNDTVSRYLNQLKNKLLKLHPNWQNEIHVYLVKSAAVNAFTTPDGGIFINMGLISRLNNEDELAFVLSHEIGHYVKKHSIQGYIKNKEIDQKSRKENEKELSSALQKCQYSQKSEMEADLWGLTLFEDSGYSWNAIPTVFEILKNSNLPVFDVDHSIALYGSSYYTIDAALLDSVNLKVNRVKEAEDSEFSSHPAPEKRKTILLENAQKSNQNITLSNSFNHCKSVCNYNLLNQYTLNFDFFEGLYMSSYLLNSDPNNAYLQYHLIRNLYGITRVMEQGNVDGLINYDDVQKHDFHLNAYNLLFNELTQGDRLKLSLGKALDYVENKGYRLSEVKAIAFDLNSILQNKNNNIDTSANIQVLKSIELKPVPKLSPVDICASGTEAQSTSLDKTTLIVNPDFFRINLTKKESFIYLSTINKQKWFNSSLSESSLSSRLSTQLLDIKSLNSDETVLWNEITILQQFIKESNWVSSMTGFVYTQNQELTDIRLKYNADEILLATSVSIRTRRNFIKVAMLVTWSVALFPIPFAIYSLARPNDHSFLFAKTISLKNGSTHYTYENHLKLLTSKGVIGANVYNMMKDYKRYKKQ